MKKNRILCAFFAAAFAVIGSGCSGGDVKVSFDDVKPWSNYEVCEYEVQRWYVEDGENVTVVASGTYTATIATVGDDTNVTNEFSLTYNDSVRTLSTTETGRTVVSRGCTDTYTGTVACKRDSLVPTRAEKVQNVQQRPLCDSNGAPYLPEAQLNPAEGVVCRYVLPEGVRYHDPRGYSYSADYENNVAHFTTTEGRTYENGAGGYNRDYAAAERDFAIENNTRFDNEQLMMLVRAFSSTARKGSATFYLSNFYDSYVRDAYIRYTMGMSCAENHTAFTLDLPADKFVLTDTEGRIEPNSQGKYDVSCISASVSISSETPGPAVNFLVIDPSVSLRPAGASESSRGVKVVAQMTFTEYSYQNASVAYRTVYTLKDYRTTQE